MSYKCRICYKNTKSTNAKKLFEAEQNVLIFQIELLTGEWLSDEQDWPSYICKRCENDLTVAAAFRERCVQTQHQLRQEQIMADAKPDHLDPLNIVQESHTQSDEGWSANESVKSSSSDTKSMLDKVINGNDFLLVAGAVNTHDKHNEMQKWQAEEELQIKLESSEQEEGTIEETQNSQVKIDTEKPMVSNRTRRRNIKWNLVTEEEARKRIRERNSGDYICDQCGKHFTHISNLRVHLIRHTGERNYECSICKKRFKIQQELTIHEGIHKDIRRYACRYCDMTFHRCGGRVSHERRTHTFERPFKCRYCEKTFSLYNARKGHEVVHLDVRKYRCELCNESFKKSFTLTQHKRSKKHKSKEESEKNNKNLAHT